MHNLLQGVEWSKQKFVAHSLQVYGLATPLVKLVSSKHQWMPASVLIVSHHYRFVLEKLQENG